ncbi:MAG: ABC transporter ATP-binding protein [Tissierellia bacterium]|nr:ABC transporter ATP-binding protein [Tissierellia bacterium]
MQEKQEMKQIFGSYRKSMALAAFTGILSTLSAQGVIIQLQMILDILIYDKRGDLRLHMVTAVALIFANMIFAYFFQYYIRFLMLSGDFPLRKRMFLGSVRKEPSEISSSGDQLNRITNDAEHISKAYTSSKVLMFTQTVQLFATLGIMFYYSVPITFIVLFFVFLCYVGTHILNKKIGIETVELQRIRGEENQMILQSIGSIKTIFQLNKPKYFAERYMNFLKKEKEPVVKRLSKFHSLYGDIFSFLFNLMPFIILLLAVEGMRKGTMTVGGALALQTICGALPEPIQHIAAYLNERRISKNLTEKNKDVIVYEKKEERKKLPLPKASLAFSSKGFTFGEKEMLKDVDFHIDSGEIVTITGESGSGKSTLLNLLSGFLKPQNGKIQIGGVNMKDLGMGLYDLLLQVEQSSILIEGSLRDNLCLGDPFDKEEIEEAIDTAELSKLVSHVGLDYEIEEGGKNLSGGERQRVGIARMLLRKPKILLLDEPTSALDEATGKAMTEKLVAFAKKYEMTMIAVTHKKDFQQHSDQRIHLTN